MIKKINKKIVLILSVLVLMLAFSVTASAEQKVSLTLICRQGDTILTGMNWRLYYVARRTTNGYELDGGFKNYDITIDTSSADAMNTAAVTLENYAIIDQVVPIDGGLINREGKLLFPELESGLYMVSGDIFNVEEVFYQPSVSFVEIDTEADKANVDLVVYPKVKYALLSEINLNNVLKKIWKDNKTTHDPLDIEIYKNARLFKTVTLSEENNWTYRWKATDVSDWRMKELNVPKDYVIEYKSDNGKYAIENTYIGVEPTTTTTYIKPTLPQTGQLWWPVLVMGGAGIILIVIGTRLKLKKAE